MVSKIEAFQTIDGLTFPSLEQAEEHEKQLKFKEEFTKFFDENYKGIAISKNIKTSVIEFIINNIETIRSL